MSHQRLKVLFEKYMSSTASPEESAEFMDLVLLKEHEDLLRGFLNEALETENEYRLPSSASESILTNIFAEGKKNDPIRPKKNKRGTVLAIYSIAAVVILLIGFSLYFEVIIKQQNTLHPAIVKKEKTHQTDIPPGTNQATLTLGNGRRIFLDSTANGNIAGQQGVSLINIHGSLTYQNNGVSEAQPEYNMVSVPRKGQYHLILSDGTRVWLNASSSLRFPAAFSGPERIVELTGEGYFEVAKDPSKPFHVKAGSTDVQALGTHFNVMAYTDERALQATLLEGAVKVTREKEIRFLKPGQAAEVASDKKNIEIKPADIDEVMAWKEGYFLFSDKTPLPSMMRQMERWYDIDVNYEGEVPDQNFGGGIQRSLPLSGVLSILKDSGIKFKVDNKTLTISK